METFIGETSIRDVLEAESQDLSKLVNKFANLLDVEGNLNLENADWAQPGQGQSTPVLHQLVALAAAAVPSCEPQCFHLPTVGSRLQEAAVPGNTVDFTTLVETLCRQVPVNTLNASGETALMAALSYFLQVVKIRNAAHPVQVLDEGKIKYHEYITPQLLQVVASLLDNGASLHHRSPHGAAASHYFLVLLGRHEPPSKRNVPSKGEEGTTAADRDHNTNGDHSATVVSEEGESDGVIRFCEVVEAILKADPFAAMLRAPRAVDGGSLWVSLGDLSETKGMAALVGKAFLGHSFKAVDAAAEAELLVNTNREDAAAALLGQGMGTHQIKATARTLMEAELDGAGACTLGLIPSFADKNGFIDHMLVESMVRELGYTPRAGDLKAICLEIQQLCEQNAMASFSCASIISAFDGSGNRLDSAGRSRVHTSSNSRVLSAEGDLIVTVSSSTAPAYTGNMRGLSVPSLTTPGLDGIEAIDPSQLPLLVSKIGLDKAGALAGDRGTDLPPLLPIDFSSTVAVSLCLEPTLLTHVGKRERAWTLLGEAIGDEDTTTATRVYLTILPHFVGVDGSGETYALKVVCDEDNDCESGCRLSTSIVCLPSVRRWVKEAANIFSDQLVRSITHSDAVLDSSLRGVLLSSGFAQLLEVFIHRTTPESIATRLLPFSALREQFFYLLQDRYGTLLTQFHNRYSLTEACLEEREGLVPQLLELLWYTYSGRDSTVGHSAELPPRVLTAAARSNRLDNLKAVLTLHMTALDTPDHHGDTVLMAAVKNYSTLTAQYLVDLRPDLDVVDAQGQTALALAAARGLDSIVTNILKLGPASVNLLDKQGLGALHHALLSGTNQRTSMSLLNYQAAQHHGHSDHEPRTKIDVNSCCQSRGLNPLLAAKFNNPELCHPLLNKGAHALSDVTSAAQRIAAHLLALEYHFTFLGNLVGGKTAAESETNRVLCKRLTANSCYSTFLHWSPDVPYLTEDFAALTSPHFTTHAEDDGAVVPSAAEVTSGALIVSPQAPAAATEHDICRPSIPFALGSNEESECQLRDEVLAVALTHIQGQLALLSEILLTHAAHRGAAEIQSLGDWERALWKAAQSAAKKPPTCRNTVESSDLISELAAATHVSQRCLFLQSLRQKTITDKSLLRKLAQVCESTMWRGSAEAENVGAAAAFTCVSATPLLDVSLVLNDVAAFAGYPKGTWRDEVLLDCIDPSRSGHVTVHDLSLLVDLTTVHRVDATFVTPPQQHHHVRIGGEDQEEGSIGGGEEAPSEEHATDPLLPTLLPLRGLEALFQLASSGGLKLFGDPTVCEALLSTRVPFKFITSVLLGSAALYYTDAKRSLRVKHYEDCSHMEDDVRYMTSLRLPEGKFYCEHK